MVTVGNLVYWSTTAKCQSKYNDTLQLVFCCRVFLQTFMPSRHAFHVVTGMSSSSCGNTSVVTRGVESVLAIVTLDCSEALAEPIISYCTCMPWGVWFFFVDWSLDQGLCTSCLWCFSVSLSLETCGLSSILLSMLSVLLWVVIFDR